MTCRYDLISLGFEPSSFQSLDFHLLTSPLVHFQPLSTIPSHCIYNLRPGTMQHQSKIHSTSVVPPHGLSKVRLLYQDSSSGRFFTSRQTFQRDSNPPRMNDKQKPRAICRNFIYHGVCDYMPCPRAHVPHKNLVRSVVTHAPHPLYNLTCFPSSCSLNNF